MPAPAMAPRKGAPRRLSISLSRTLGGLDIAFNNAATLGELGPVYNPVYNIALAGWRNTLDTNLTSAFLGAKYQVPPMIARGGGSIVFTSTFVGHSVGMPGMSACAASKSGLMGLTQTLAVEHAQAGFV